MFVRIRGLKVLAVGAALVVVTPSVFAVNMCKTGYDECKQHNLDPDDLAHKEAGTQIGASYCKQIGLNKKGCAAERDLAIAYTAMAAVCTTVCVLELSGYGYEVAQALKPVCFIGSAAVSATEIIWTGILQHQAKKYSEDEKKLIGVEFGITGSSVNFLLSGLGALSNLQVITNTYGQAASQGVKSSRSSACIPAALNAIFAVVKNTDRNRIIDSSISNLTSVQEVWTDKPTNSGGGGSQQNPALLSGGGGSSPPPIADTRSPAAEAGYKDDKVDTARIGESYATADTSKLFGNPKAADFQRALDALGKYTGATADGLANSLESSGVAGTLSKFAGDSDFGKKLSDDLANMEKKISGQSSGLAFEKTSGGGAGGGGKKDGGMDLSSLFGARGPAGDGAGGVKSIQFGGFNNDIWHAGTTLSIFEIVSRKTQTVSSRVGR